MTGAGVLVSLSTPGIGARGISVPGLCPAPSRRRRLQGERATERGAFAHGSRSRRRAAPRAVCAPAEHFTGRARRTEGDARGHSEPAWLTERGTRTLGGGPGRMGRAHCAPGRGFTSPARPLKANGGSCPCRAPRENRQVVGDGSCESQAECLMRAVVIGFHSVIRAATADGRRAERGRRTPAGRWEGATEPRGRTVTRCMTGEGDGGRQTKGQNVERRPKGRMRSARRESPKGVAWIGWRLRRRRLCCRPRPRLGVAAAWRALVSLWLYSSPCLPPPPP